MCDPKTAAHQAPLSPGFSRQEHWSGLPFPFPMHESKRWKWSRSIVSDSSRPHRLQPTRLLCPWDFPSKSTGVGCHCFIIPWMDILKSNSSSVLALGIFLQTTEDSNQIFFPVLYLFYLDKPILPSFHSSLVNSSFASLKTIKEVISIYLFDHSNMKLPLQSIYVNT